MSFVTKEIWSPAGNCLTCGGTCASASVTMRNAFLRVPPQHEYAVESLTNREFDHFGIFRSHQPTYARGGTGRVDDAQRSASRTRNAVPAARATRSRTSASAG